MKANNKRNHEYNLEKDKESSRKWREDNPEKLKAYSKKYCREHKEERKTYDKKYRKTQNGKERKLMSNHKRRAKERANGGSYTIEEIMKLRVACFGICKGYNRRPHFVGWEKLEVDHIIPITKGGSSDIDNLQLLCRSCNASKGNKIFIQIEGGKN